MSLAHYNVNNQNFTGFFYKAISDVKIRLIIVLATLRCIILLFFDCLFYKIHGKCQKIALQIRLRIGGMFIFTLLKNKIRWNIFSCEKR